MADKLQEKFALVQQMKREKELREAKAKEHKSFDIFAIAGKLSGATQNAPSRPDFSSNPRPAMARRQSTVTSTGGSCGALKRPHVDRNMSSMSSSSESFISETVKAGPTTDSNSSPTLTTTPPASADRDSEVRTEKKLKRSSMARGTSSTTINTTQRRPSTQGPLSAHDPGLASPTHYSSTRRPSISALPVSAQARKLSTSSYSEPSPNHDVASTTGVAATPPTPIPSPRSSKDDGTTSQPSTHPHPHQQRHQSQTQGYYSSENLECPEGMPPNEHADTCTHRPRRLSSDDYSEEEIGYRVSSRSPHGVPSDARSPQRYNRQDSYDGASQHSVASRSRSPSRSPRSLSRPRSMSRSEASPRHHHGKESSGGYSNHLDDHYRRAHYDPHPYGSRNHDDTDDRYRPDMGRRDSAMTPVDPTDPYGVADRCLHVSDLPSSTTRATLVKAFEEFGAIKDIHFVPGVDHGFVTFQEPEAAQLALDKSKSTRTSGSTTTLSSLDEEGTGKGTSSTCDISKVDVACTGIQVDGVSVQVNRTKLPSSSSESRSGAGSGVGAGGVGDYLTSPPYQPNYGGITHQVATIKPRLVHQLPPKPRVPVPLPPKPTGAAAFPPALPASSSLESVAAVPTPAPAGRSRQILSYDDL
ncbi:hypothetical protein BGZ83_000031 [Gryganskiella cystojenkinii]|nr:hypothetical protein BGZ83_000031 [Gryganskiella cystojenkinii]